MGGPVLSFSKKQLLLAATAGAVALTLVLLLAPISLGWGLAALTILGAGGAAYLARAVRRIFREVEGNGRNLHAVQQRLAAQQKSLRGTVASLTALASQDRFELVSVLEAQTKAIEAAAGQIAHVEQQLSDVTGRIGETALAVELHRTQKTLDHVRDLTVRTVEKAEQNNYAQIEALLGLRDLLPPRTAMPPMRGWAAAPTTLLRLVEEILDRRPELVVECGSGVSSLWVGYALEKIGKGRCITLEHDEAYAAQTREALARHGLSSVVEVRDAPLRPVDSCGETFQWYDLAALHDVQGAEVVFVDGPPGATGPMARFPAAPVLQPRLSERGAVLVLDDADRPEEQELQERWAEQVGATVLARSRAEKGWSVLALSAR